MAGGAPDEIGRRGCDAGKAAGEVERTRVGEGRAEHRLLEEGSGGREPGAPEDFGDVLGDERLFVEKPFGVAELATKLAVVHTYWTETCEPTTGSDPDA